MPNADLTENNIQLLVSFAGNSRGVDWGTSN